MAHEKSTDYFSYIGYKKMMLSLLRQTAADLMLSPGEKNDAIRQEAMDWVMAPQASVKPEDGLFQLTFHDCLAAIGVASHHEAYQRRFVEKPHEVFQALAKTIEEMGLAEGVYAEARNAREPEPLSTTGLTMGWMFGREPGSSEAR